MKKVPLGITGKITNENNQELYIRVIHDMDNTGGYYILTSARPDMKFGFDDWVESENDLVKFIIDSNWIINWPDLND